MNNEIFGFTLTYLESFLVLVYGLFIGILFFTSLWWSTSRGLVSASPVKWFIVSFCLRMSATVYAFYLVAQGDGWRLSLALLGFIIGRYIIKSRVLGRMEAKHAA